MWVNELEGSPTMSFVLYTINVECMCDASYVAWKYRQCRRFHVIFARKYQNLQNVNMLGGGGRFNSSRTKFANHEGTFTDLDSDFILQLLKNVISIKIRFVVFNHIDTVLKFTLNAINECWKKKIFWYLIYMSERKNKRMK